MSKIARLAVLVTALASLFAVLASTASAVTWHNSGDTHFVATGGAGTLSSTGTSLGCTGADVTGTVTGNALGGMQQIGATLSVDATAVFTGCAFSGTTLGVECGLTFTGVVQPTSSVTTGFTDLTCGWYLGGAKVCHVEGTIHSEYTNPSGTTPGKLTLTTSSPTVTNGSSGSCFFGNGDVAHLTHLAFNVVDTVQPLGPVITRTV
jgi:hypothetical protein